MSEEILKDDETTDELDASSSLGMSDEDFLKAEPPESLEDEAVDGDGESDKDNSDKAGDDADPDKKDESENKDDNKDADADDSSTADNNGDGSDDSGTVGKNDSTGGTGDLDAVDDNISTAGDGNNDNEKDNKTGVKGKVDKTDDSSIDFKAEYEKVMATFNANGVEMKPKNVDDVVRLMQMGANYHKKMAGLKPSMKVLKLLEKNNLLDQEKLNYLIDLNAKDPAAITKLLKDSGIDPLDINVKDEPNYKPTSRNVSDTEIDLDQVLDSIKDTPSYSKTLNVITQVWDDTSRSIIADTPHIISVINGHMADGTYDTVMGAVEYERGLGRLKGISDLDAYKQMGDQLQSKGKLGPVPDTSTDSKIPDQIPVKDKTKSTGETERQKRKKAASPTKQGSKTAALKFNPLEMSDDEIENFDESTLPTG